MKKISLVSIMFIFILQSFLSPISAWANDQAEGFVLTDSLVAEDTESEGEFLVTADWAYTVTGNEEDQTYLFPLPDGVAVAEEQTGELKIDQQPIGNYTVKSDGIEVFIFADTEVSGSGQFQYIGEQVITDPADTPGEPAKEPAEGTSEGTTEEKAEEAEQAKSEEAKSDGVSEELTTVEDEGSPAADITAESESEQAETEKGSEDIIQPFQANTDITENILTSAKLTFQNEVGESVDRVTTKSVIIADYEWALENGHTYTDGATFHFQVPSELKVYSEVKDEPLWFGDQSVGTFSVALDGNATVVFNDFIERHSNIKGTLQVLTSIKGTNVITSERIVTVTPIQGEASIDIPVKFEPAGSTIDKRGVPNRTYNTDHIVWTVDLNKHLQKIDHAVFKDPIPSGQELDRTTVEVYKLKTKLDGSVEVDGKVEGLTVGKIDNKDFQIELGNIDQAYRIVFTTLVQDQESSVIENKAYLSGTDLPDQTASASVSVTRGKPLEKRSIGYDPVTQTITWEIKFNYNEKPVSAKDTLLEDRFNDSQVLTDFNENQKFLVEEVTIDENGKEAKVVEVDSSKYTIADLPVENGKNGFKFQFKEGIEKAYKITYKTKAASRVFDDVAKIKNTVTFGEKSAAGERNIGQQILIKENEGVNYKEKTASWKIVFNKDKYPMENVFLTDTFPKKGLMLKEGTLVIKGSKQYVEDEDYKVLEVNEDGFKIDFLKTVIDEEITITYQTDFNYENLDKTNDEDPSKKDNNRFINHALLSWKAGNESFTKDAKDHFTADTYTQNNGFKNGSYNATTKKITWNVGLNYDLKKMESAQVVDFIKGDQDLDRDSLKVYKLSLTGAANGTTKGELYTDYDVVWDPEGKQGFKLTFNGPIDSGYHITYDTSLENKLITNKYENTAIVSDGSKDVKEHNASVSVSNGGKYTNKEGKQNGKIIDWSIDINFGQSAVADAKVIDTPKDDHQRFLKDSFVLYETSVEKNGTVVKGDELGKDKYELTFPVSKDGIETFEVVFKEKIDRPYILEYKSLILTKVGDTISNSAVFSGNGISVDETISNSFIQVAHSAGMGTGSGEVGSLTVKKIDSANREKLLPGATFTLKDAETGTEIETLTTGDKGEVTFKNLLFGRYTLFESEAPSGYLVKDIETTVLLEASTQVIEIENKKIIRDVQLVKRDQETKEVLKGAEFELQIKEGDRFETLTTYTTDENGRILVKDLEAGDYQFVEKTAPEFYLLDSDPITFKIEADQTEVLEVIKENKRGKGKLSIQKVDAADGKPLEGAKFNIYNSDGKLSGSKLTGEDGVAEFTELPYDHYTIKEAVAPEGYVLGKIEIDNVTVDAKNPSPVMKVENKKIIRDVQLIKKDQETKEVLKGAEFELQRKNGNDLETLDTYTTDENGSIVIKDLEPGDYQFVEVKAPQFYLLKADPIAFKIEADQTAPIKLEQQNERGKGKLSIQKVDAADGSPLKGAEFHIYNSNNELSGIKLTDENGVAEFADLPYDHYTIKEAVAPEGYLISKIETDRVTVDAETPSPVIEVENKKIIRDVQLIKKDQETKEVLKGAEFELQKKDGNDFKTLDTYTTDENGSIVVKDLEPGDYQFVEVKAPEFYLLNSNPISFKIDADQTAPIEIEQENERGKGKLILHKVDTETGASLAGAEFELFNSENISVGKATTDQDGRIVLSHLLYGHYTLKEIKAPDGYILAADTKLEITINEIENEIVIQNDKIKQAFKLKKVSAEDPSTGLSDAIFKLMYKKEKTDEYTEVEGKTAMVTDQNGEIYAENLEAGFYQLIEVKAPKGYQLDNTPIEFTIEENQLAVKELVMTNKPIPVKPDPVKPEDPAKPNNPNSTDGKGKPVKNLPQTGEASQSMSIYMGGILLMLIGGALLMFNRRTETDK
ncbi:SpaA isopeptide-forming pilin-related protein [Cytobacillus gottheilii]|uniref:SpaA isopeptide-forming pilin-related protein n=1 Tax=Cytobacillus gottheilii TaxID=859144 RepID=UPI0009BB4429|nr:SpaA isopeptide-forming pilin-related protein [Cytobacillus gottheilii]